MSPTLRDKREDARDYNAYLIATSKYLSPLEISRRSEAMSLTTRVFARMMAQVDREAVSLSENHKTNSVG